MSPTTPIAAAVAGRRPCTCCPGPIQRRGAGAWQAPGMAVRAAAPFGADAIMNQPVPGQVPRRARWAGARTFFLAGSEGLPAGVSRKRFRLGLPWGGAGVETRNQSHPLGDALERPEHP